jgi:hypothetical protein
LIAGRFRSPSPVPLRGRQFSSDARTDCGERYLLRAEYIERLAEFNQAAARQRLAAGMQGTGAEKAWRNLQAKCAASNAAWARYRKHVASHGCKHGTRAGVDPAA